MPLSRLRISILFSILALSTWAQAQEWTGTISAKEVSFPLPLNGPINNNLNPLEVNLIREMTFGHDWQAKVHLMGVVDPENNSQTEQAYGDLPEFYLGHRWSNWTFKAGTDIFSWGVTDGDNPLDIVNTKMYFDPLHARKMGAGAVQASWSGENNQLDLIYIPYQRSPVLPGGNSRWLPRQVYIAQNTATNGIPTEILLPGSFTYNYSPATPQMQANQNNVAARWQWRWEDWEIGFYGYEGISPLPIVQPYASASLVEAYPIFIVQTNSAIILQTQDYRQQMTGASFVKSISSFQLKGEIAYTNPEGQAAGQRGTEADSVLALEKTWNIGENGTFITILQYGYSQHANNGGNDVSSISHFFDNNWMGIIRGTYRDSETFTAFYSNDQELYSWASDLSYEHRWSDFWKSTLEVLLLDGPLTSPVGAYAANKSIAVSVDYSF